MLPPLQQQHTPASRTPALGAAGAAAAAPLRGGPCRCSSQSSCRPEPFHRHRLGCPHGPDPCLLLHETCGIHILHAVLRPVRAVAEGLGPVIKAVQSSNRVDQQSAVYLHAPLVSFSSHAWCP
jgi:hypothetical protein